MSTVNLILINTVIITLAGQTQPLQAGQKVTDPAIEAAAQAVGGVFGPATDPNLVAAAATCAKLRAKGRNESELTTIMMAAYASTSYGAAVQEALYTLTAAEVVALGGVLTGTLAFPAALPAGARFMGAEVAVAVAAAGVTTLVMELGDGTTAALYLANTVNLKSATKQAPAGSATPLMSAGAVTPTITLTSTGTDLNTVTGLAATVKLFYVVMP